MPEDGTAGDRACGQLGWRHGRYRSCLSVLRRAKGFSRQPFGPISRYYTPSEACLEIQAGLHTGEIELAGDDVEDVTIHIGARIAALADTGEVLVSRTIKDLVVGSGLTFRDRGVYMLKGVPDQWQLFAAAIN